MRCPQSKQPPYWKWWQPLRQAEQQQRQQQQLEQDRWIPLKWASSQAQHTWVWDSWTQRLMQLMPCSSWQLAAGQHRTSCRKASGQHRRSRQPQHHRSLQPHPCVRLRQGSRRVRPCLCLLLQR